MSHLRHLSLLIRRPKPHQNGVGEQKNLDRVIENMKTFQRIIKGFSNSNELFANSNSNVETAQETKN